MKASVITRAIIYSDLLVHTVTSGGDPVLVDESPPTPVGGGEPEERGATDGHLRERVVREDDN